MPISGPTSYVPVTEEFLGHWAARRRPPLPGTDRRG